MSTFEDGRYRWRETCFVLFPAARRPTLKAVQKVLSALNKRYLLTNLSADRHGRFESLTLLSPEDYAALDVCFTCGDEVVEQGVQLAEDLQRGAVTPEVHAALKTIAACDGRFDVLHFEQVLDLPEDEEDGDDLLDPSTLLAVLAALAEITGGVAVDPQSGTILGEEGEA
ncbi:MAG: hypothetical protein ABSG68_18505 [Thermoguttaceae bacterium]|jgi:hypothetical protein